MIDLKEPVSNTTDHVSRAEIEAWLVAYIADLRGIKKEKISQTKNLSKYGLDSASAVTLTGDLMDWLKIDIEPTLLYEYPTIEQAARHIASLHVGAARE